MTKRMVVMLLVVGVVLGGIFGWKYYSGYQQQQAMSAMAMPAVVVSTAEVRAERWSPTIPAVGSLRAKQGVDVTAQIAGQITRLYFRSGQAVESGDLLVQLYTADDEARLEGLRADTQLAETNLQRAEELLAKELISDTDYDTRRTDLLRARAAEANLRLIIEQKSIRAPFGGRLGIRQVDVGQYIEPGDTIVRLESFEQILVDFPVPQRNLGKLSVNQSIRVRADAWPGEEFAGQIDALESQVDRDTRNLQIQGIVDNADERLLPGMFVEVEIMLPAREDVVTVPQSAVTYSPYGDSVFVVTAGEAGEPVVRNNFVVTGATRGDQVAIVQGVEPGMVVVTAGQQKLRNGSRVRVDNSVAVSSSPDPQPANN